jgi:motility quorum-sensing regulator / GCU-specific mRNA interferase toxin
LALALGLTAGASAAERSLVLRANDVAAAIATLEAGHFYKSMASYRDRRRWQDVYHLPYGGMVLYVKFVDDVVTEFTLLSFKET